MKSKNGQPYSSEELQFILENYEEKGAKWIADRIGRNRTGVKQKGRALGLYYKGPMLGLYQKGSVSHNKGKRMSAEMKEKVKHTFFKKGSTPVNHKPVGTIVTRKMQQYTYKWIKIAEPKKWELLHRVIYQEQFGSIPKGGVVRFKDGNKINVEIDNLELINTNENMRRNSIMRFPREVRDICRLLGKLKKTIKDATEQD